VQPIIHIPSIHGEQGRSHGFIYQRKPVDICGFRQNQFGLILLDDRFSVKKINFFRNLKKLKIDESTKLMDKLKNRTINHFGRQTRSMGQKTNR
jgi:hypothetical protein